jgi:hypothetical protein
MAGSKSDYLEAIILNLVLGATAYTAATNICVALSTAAYSDGATGASMTEVTNANSYARISQTNNATNWPAASGTAPTTKANGTAVTFVAATGSWGTILSAYMVDVVTYGSGNVLYGADLTVTKTVSSGDTASFAIGAITVTED